MPPHGRGSERHGSYSIASSSPALAHSPQRASFFRLHACRACALCVDQKHRTRDVAAGAGEVRTDALPIVRSYTAEQRARNCAELFTTRRITARNISITDRSGHHNTCRAGPSWQGLGERDGPPCLAGWPPATALAAVYFKKKQAHQLTRHNIVQSRDWPAVPGCISSS